MEFKEFSEYTDPESMDYDIKKSLSGNNNSANVNVYAYQLAELIGFLEEGEEYLLDEYGITMDEYLHPTAEVVAKVKESLEDSKSRNK